MIVRLIRAVRRWFRRYRPTGTVITVSNGFTGTIGDESSPFSISLASMPEQPIVSTVTTTEFWRYCTINVRRDRVGSWGLKPEDLP